MLAGFLGAWPIFVFVWALAVTTGTTRAQTTSTFPTTVEFDVAFPRNEIYAPDALLPIVIAIQNPQAVGPLVFSTGWSIYWRGVNASSDAIDSGYNHMIGTNYSTAANEPYFESIYTNALNGTEGQFSLVLDLNIRNCTRTEGSLNFGQVSTIVSVDFELRNGAQHLSNSSIVTSKDSCPVGLASFTIKKTVRQNTDPLFADTCAVLADPAPKMNPCAVEINSTAASRIFAGVAASACNAKLLTSDCPSPDEKSNTAAQLDLKSLGWPGIAGGLVLGVALLVFHK